MTRQASRVRCSRAAAAAVTLTLLAAGTPAAVPEQPAVRLAVFEFELVDATPSAVLLGESTSAAASLAKMSAAARAELARSSRYHVIDASQTSAQAGKPLHECAGCEAALALQLGADQSLLGVVSRVTQTDYYVVIQIRDAHSGKLLDQQEANFAGAEEGWPSGVRMLIKHQVLAAPQ